MLFKDTVHRFLRSKTEQNGKSMHHTICLRSSVLSYLVFLLNKMGQALNTLKHNEYNIYMIYNNNIIYYILYNDTYLI